MPPLLALSPRPPSASLTPLPHVRERTSWVAFSSSLTRRIIGRWSPLKAALSNPFEIPQTNLPNIVPTVAQLTPERSRPNTVLTFGSPDRHKTAPVSYGGYSDSIVVDEPFVLRMPS
jgi:hypothetical protein